MTSINHRSECVFGYETLLPLYAKMHRYMITKLQSCAHAHITPRVMACMNIKGPTYTAAELLYALQLRKLRQEMTEGVLLFLGVFTFFASIVCYVIGMGLAWGFYVLDQNRSSIAFAAAIIVTIQFILTLALTLVACGLRKQKEGRYSFAVSLAVIAMSGLLTLIAIILVIVGLTQHPHKAVGAFTIIFNFLGTMLNCISLGVTYMAGRSFRG